MAARVLSTWLLLSALFLVSSHANEVPSSSKTIGVNGIPMVICTWPFVDAAEKGWQVLHTTGSPVKAAVAGCTVCEDEQCDMAVGFGGSPDEHGETTLDAIVMDGETMDVGAVGALRRVKGAARAALHVLEQTQHSLMVGDQAVAFALSMGLPGPENLTTPASEAIWSEWKAKKCQPNFWQNVIPESSSSCGPYVATAGDRYNSYNLIGHKERRRPWGRLPNRGTRKSPFEGSKMARPQVSRKNHDTITMVAIAEDGRMAAAGSTNGLTYKIPGRVGDTAMPGAGVYVDSEFGGCGATGDGDIMMRFVPCYQAVESLRRGFSPQEAADDAIGRIGRKYPDFVGALFVVNNKGEHAGAVANWVFQYTVISPNSSAPDIYTVMPKQARQVEQN